MANTATSVARKRLRELVGEAEKKRDAAQLAAERVRKAIAAGRVASDRDLEQIDGYCEAVRDLSLAVWADEDANGADDLDSLRIEVEEREAALEEREQEVVRLLSELPKLAAAAPDETAKSLLLAPIERARILCESGAIDDPESLTAARGLVALVRLNGCAEGEKAALTAEATKNLPADCQAAVGLAAYGNLPLNEGLSEADKAEPDGGAAPSSDGAAESARDSKEPLGASAPNDAEAQSVAEPTVSGTSSFADPEKAVEASDEEVEAVLGALLREGRFGLASWIAEAWTPTREDGLDHALKAIAYATAIQSGSGEAVTRFRDLVQHLPSDAIRNHGASGSIAVAAGLRANVVAQFSGGGELLNSVAHAYADDPDLSALVEAMVTAGQRGLSALDLTAQVQGIASAEDDLRAVQDRAGQMLRLSTIKYARASKVWLKWIEPTGMLGSLLNPVVENRVTEIESVHEAVLGLRNTKTLERRLDETDRRYTSANRRRKIVEDARSKLLERAEESLGIVSEWVDLSRALEQDKQRQADEDWQKGPFNELRTTARDVRERVTASWKAKGEASDLAGSAARGTLPIITEIFELVVDGKTPDGLEAHPDEILGLDLLRAPHLGLDARLEPTEQPSLGSLIAAARSQTWTEAFEARIEEANFAAAGRIVEVIGRDDPESAQKLNRVRLNRLTEKRDHLTDKLAGATRHLGSARREGRISDAESLTLSSRLAALGLHDGEQDFRGRDDELSKFVADLRRAEEEGAQRARDQYRDRLAEAELQPHRERLERLLDEGEVATFEELLLAIDRGEDLPEEKSRFFNQLNQFFPDVVADGKVAGFGRDGNALVEAIEKKGSFGKLDFSSLKDEEVEPVKAAVESWRRLDCNELKTADDDLERILDLIGLTVENGVDARAWQKQGGDKRRQGEIIAKPLGKALVPAFGSAAQGGRYKLLMLWERMSDDAITGLISQQDGEQPIIVLHFGGGLPETVRRGIADQLRHQPIRRGVALIDSAAFLYLASKGGRKLATTMRITLPFSAINPYTPFAPGSVPLEMFYGRGDELYSVIDRGGTSFLYGGRRLGKSALLRAAQRKFETEAPGSNKAVYVDLKTKGIGEREPTGLIVSEVAKALKDAGVMTHSGAKDPSFEEVRTQVKGWLEVDEMRRILLLLDECDAFLNEDAKAGFEYVTELKSLMQETEHRFKPVFAGLHQVRRFERIPNQPLAHLGPPTPIGPLKPQPAYDLTTKPLEALGLKFETPDLPSRILTATNYQPSLIQLFCSELVDHMLTKSCGPGTPPYVVTSADVEAVHGNQRVLEEMRSRFELTTNLDPRYRVIANSVAVETVGSDLAVGLSPSEIRAMCDEYWPAGFARTGSDEFRSLLEEMDSLGLLFEDGEGRFQIRSPNVMRMLGTAEQIEESLSASHELDLPQEFEAATFRDRFEGDPYRRQPLTHEQVAALVEDPAEESLVRIVVGSEATGIGDTMVCLQELYDDGSKRFNFKDDSVQTVKKLRARFNRPPKSSRRVIAYSLAGREPSDALVAIRSLAEKLAEPGLRSTLVFVLDAEGLAAWRELVVPESGADGVGSEFDRIELIELKRWSKSGLRAWALGQDVELFFSKTQALEELMRVTGGWPMLVDRVVEAYGKDHDWRRATASVEQWLESPDGAAAFRAAIGLENEGLGLGRVMNLLADYADPIAREEFQALAADEGIDDAGTLAELLRSMQVLELDSMGRYVCERTAGRAWRRSRLPLSDAAS